jgi:hypothetical protein
LGKKFSGRLGRNVLNSADANDVERADHDGVFIIRKRDDDLLADHGSVLRMLHPENLATAAMDFKRLKWRVLQKLSDLLKHGDTLQLGSESCNPCQPNEILWFATCQKWLANPRFTHPPARVILIHSAEFPDCREAKENTYEMDQ